jgi:hypothetical protein
MNQMLVLCARQPLTCLRSFPRYPPPNLQTFSMFALCWSLLAWGVLPASCFLPGLKDNRQLTWAPSLFLDSLTQVEMLLSFFSPVYCPALLEYMSSIGRKEAEPCPVFWSVTAFPRAWHIAHQTLKCSRKSRTNEQALLFFSEAMGH